MTRPVAVAVDHLVVGDGQQPGAERPISAAVAAAVQTRVGVDEDLAGGVLGLLPIKRPQPAVAHDDVPIAGEERREGLWIALRGRGQSRIAGAALAADEWGIGRCW